MMTHKGLPLLSALLSGCMFGIGLTIAGMTEPAKVLGFLDVIGAWDPTLALVMGGALAVTLPAFALILRRKHPLLASTFDLPSRRDIDGSLLVGAALFGIGWGLAGLCPGPAIALIFIDPELALPFLLAMLVGMRAHDRWGVR